MKARLDHVGIAVADLAQALAFYRDALGLEVDPPEDVPSQQVRAHFIPAGGPTLELLEATSATSPIATSIAKRGPGLHHVALESKTWPRRSRAGRAGRAADRREPRPGAHGSLVAFVHPSSTHGVLVELKQVAASRTKIAGFSRAR